MNRPTIKDYLLPLSFLLIQEDKQEGEIRILNPNLAETIFW